MRKYRPWVVLAILVVVLGGFIAGMAIRFRGRAQLGKAAARYEERTGPVDLRGYEHGNVPIMENAAVWFQAGAQSLELTEDERRTVTELATRRVSDWSDDEREVADDVVTRSALPLELLIRAGTLEKSSFDIEYRHGWRARVPEIMDLVVSARLLGVKARLDWARGDTGAALDTFGAVSRLCESLRGESLTVFQTVATLPELLAVSLAHEWGTAPGTGDATLARLLEGLPDADATAALERAFALEGAAAAATVRDGTATAGGGWWHRTRVFVTGDWLVAGTYEFWTDVASVLGGPFPDIEPGLQRLSEKEGFAFGAGVPNLKSLAGRAATGDTLEALARLALELRIEASQTGDYPDSLVAYAGVADLPLPLTGEPVAYERRPDRCAVVSAPGAAEIWTEDLTGSVRDLPFTWELPAP